MPIPGQPPHDRTHHRIDHADAAVTPTDSRADRSVAANTSTSLYRRRAVHPTDEEIRSVPALAAPISPRQPERLRSHRDNAGIEVEQHQRIPLDPGLEPDMPARRGEPPVALETALTLERAERAHRESVFEPLAPQHVQPAALLTAVRGNDGHDDTGIRQHPVRDRTRHTDHRPAPDRCANRSDLDSPSRDTTPNDSSIRDRPSR